MLDVKVEFTKTALASDLAGEESPRKVSALSWILAKAVKQRVAVQGKPEGRVPAYDTSRPREVSPRYPVSAPPTKYREAGESGVVTVTVGGITASARYRDRRVRRQIGGETLAGAKVFESSEAMHRAAGTKGGSYNVSGGMWDGLTVIVRGRSASVQFRGRSEGQGIANQRRGDEPYFKVQKARRGVAGGRIIVPRKVSNATKAATVLRSHGLNILEVSAHELESLASGLTESVIRRIPSLGGVKVELEQGQRLGGLARKFAAAGRANR